MAALFPGSGFPGRAASLPLALVLLLTAPLASADELERLLRDAREGAPVVRPQAAQRLVALGQPAAERLLAECGEGPRDLALLGADLVGVLGRFENAELRDRLWAAVADVDFPWRPAAVKGLAETARDEEAARYGELLADPLAAVRVAALGAFEALELRGRKAAVEARLTDGDDRVRRAAAALLDDWGEPWALAWLVEELKREDRYFESPTGRTARYEAIRLIAARLGERFGYRPGQPPSEEANRAALAEIEARCRERAGGELPELPAVARAAPATEGDVIGLELRSCRRGEFYLRWNRDDTLLVGKGNAVRVSLPEGTVAGLLAAAREQLGELGDERSWGAGGCDAEVFRWVPEGESRARVYRVSKGPQAVEGLRPAELGRLAEGLLATVPEGVEDGLRERVGAALELSLIHI